MRVRRGDSGLEDWKWCLRLYIETSEEPGSIPLCKMSDLGGLRWRKGKKMGVGDKEMEGYITSFTAFIFMCRVHNKSASAIDRKDFFPFYSSCILIQLRSCQFLWSSQFPTVNTMSPLHSHRLPCYRHIIQFFVNLSSTALYTRECAQGNGRPVAGI